ncbi:unnamed protein product [Somion occarium]|uniref:F-box domain-containing protein n=1 Tax=Somion occarium TaxID=3059160 RepID=A0ABP1E1J5_9APHY
MPCEAEVLNMPDLPISFFQEREPVERGILETEERILTYAQELLDLKFRLNQILPISRLPPEILAHIFEHLVWIVYRNYRQSQKDPRRYGDVSPYSWLRVTHVCRHWRDVARHSPPLWTQVILMNAPCVQELLTNSKGLPISVEHGRDSESLTAQESLSVVLENMPRVKQLKLTFSRRPYRALSLLPSLHAPILRNLTIITSITGDALPPVFQQSGLANLPHLESLECSGYPFLSARMLFRSTLRRLSLLPCRAPPSPAQLLESLSGLPLLESLNLDLLFPMPAFGSTQSYAEWFNSGSQSQQTVALPHLKNLVLSEASSGMASVKLLDQLRVPPWTNISLEFEKMCAHEDELRQIIPPLGAKVASVYPGHGFKTMALYTVWSPASSIQPRRIKYAVDLWDDLVPVQSLHNRDGPPPNFTLRIPKRYQHTILELFCSPLHLSFLQTLYVEKVALMSPLWARVLAQMAQVTTLACQGNFLGSLGTVLSSPPVERGRSSCDCDLLPRLKDLHFLDICFHEPYDGDSKITLFRRILDSLEVRRDRGLPIAKVVIKQAYDLTADDVESLGVFVGEMDWDGAEFD